MRFLDTDTLKFEQVPDSELHLKENQYAILSHRWGPEAQEVSFEDILSSTDLAHKKGFDKLKGFCKVASSQHCRYGWVDTCCINRKDSVELGEAINSMYRWYQRSKICVVYLEDVPQRQLTDSEWFDRGWTLQELIAPRVVSFFDHDWNLMGTKSDMAQDLSQTTNIPLRILNHTMELSDCSVAQRMSWAAKRKTSRVEDKAYSLMGLFDIYMPMIYGEREKSFLRLQQHIIQKSKDESIFAWDIDFPGSIMGYSGIYAPSPLAYAKCSKIIKLNGSRGFSESNGELPIWSRVWPRSPGTYFAVLNCTEGGQLGSRIFILVGKTLMSGEYVRLRDVQSAGRGLILSEEITHIEEQQIRVLVDPKRPSTENVLNGLRLRTLQPPGHDQCQITILSNCQTDKTDHVYQDERNRGLAGIAHFNPIISSDHSDWSNIHWVLCSFDKWFNPVILLANNKYSSMLQDLFEKAAVTGTESQEFQTLMRAYKGYIEEYRGHRWQIGEEGQWKIYNAPLSGRYSEWPDGFVTVTAHRSKGICGLVIKALNLTISIQLLPHDDLAVSSACQFDDDDQLLPPNPSREWVVDITDAGLDGQDGKKNKWIRAIFGPLA